MVMVIEVKIYICPFKVSKLMINTFQLWLAGEADMVMMMMASAACKCILISRYEWAIFYSYFF